MRNADIILKKQIKNEVYRDDGKRVDEIDILSINNSSNILSENRLVLVQLAGVLCEFIFPL